MRHHGKPEVFNSDQGSQFTSSAFTGVLQREGVAISMDGRGRALDNIFVERLWRNVKYEDVYLKGYANMAELTVGLAQYFAFYNAERPHQALGYKTPRSAYSAGIGGGALIVDKFGDPVRIPPKLDTCSAANWTFIPAQTGHLFQTKLDTLGVTTRGRGCGFTPDRSGLSNLPAFSASNLLSS